MGRDRDSSNPGEPAAYNSRDREEMLDERPRDDRRRDRSQSRERRRRSRSRERRDREEDEKYRARDRDYSRRLDEAKDRERRHRDKEAAPVAGSSEVDKQHGSRDKEGRDRERSSREQSSRGGKESRRDRLRERERELEWDAADREAEEKERRRLWELDRERRMDHDRTERHRRSRSRSLDKNRGREPGGSHRDGRFSERDERTGGRSYNRKPEDQRNGDGGAAANDAGDAEQGGVTFDAELTAEELRMMQAMGIPFTFDTTQGKHIEDDSANAGAVKIKSKRSARQYMNRRGGFNRPLPAERTGEKVIRD